MALGRQLFRQIKSVRPAVDAIFFLQPGAVRPAGRLARGFNDLEGSDQMLPALTTVRTRAST